MDMTIRKFRYGAGRWQYGCSFRVSLAVRGARCVSRIVLLYPIASKFHFWFFSGYCLCLHQIVWFCAIIKVIFLPSSSEFDRRQNGVTWLYIYIFFRISLPFSKNMGQIVLNCVILKFFQMKYPNIIDFGR